MGIERPRRRARCRCARRSSRRDLVLHERQARSARQRQGDRAQASLRSPHSHAHQSFDGGYRWSVSHKPVAAVLKLVSAKSVATKPAGSVGGTNDYVIVYRAVGRGKTALKLIEDRSFQARSTIAKFSLTIRGK
ncbi:MAG: protease inhibitor I42 family protein [Solirubrobacteraceae bacterium]